MYRTVLLTLNQQTKTGSHNILFTSRKSITKWFIQDFNLHSLKEHLKQHCKFLDTVCGQSKWNGTVCFLLACTTSLATSNIKKTNLVKLKKKKYIHNIHIYLKHSLHGPLSICSQAICHSFGEMSVFLWSCQTKKTYTKCKFQWENILTVADAGKTFENSILKNCCY